MSYHRKNNPLMRFDVWLSKVIQDEKKEELPTRPQAIAYVRVSSDGQDVASQLQACENWSKRENIPILKEFKDEGISWTVLDRRWLMEAIAFLEKENKQYIKCTQFLCTEFTRIARPEESYEWLQLVARIEATWAKVVTVLEHRDTSTDEGKLMDDIKFSLARYERKKILKRCKNWMVALGQSWWRPFGKAPVWFYKTWSKKTAQVHIDEPKAKIIATWLELFWNDVLLSKADLLHFFKRQWLTTNAKSWGAKLYMSFIEKTFSLHRIFCYAWYFVYPDWWIYEPIKWKWPWIISLELVYKIIKKLQRESLSKTLPRRTDAVSEFPLRGLILCPSCWRKLTSWYSRSKTGKKHAYYGCSNKFCRCRENIPKDLFETQFMDLLSKHTLSKELLSAFDFILKKERDNVKQYEAKQKDKKQWEKIKLENQMKALEDSMMKTQIPALYSKLESDWVILNNEKLLLEQEMQGSLCTDQEFILLSQKTSSIIYEPLTFRKKSNTQIRQLLIRVRFGWEIKYNKLSGYRTPDSWVYNHLSRLLRTDISKEKEIKEKIWITSDSFLYLDRTNFEPPSEGCPHQKGTEDALENIQKCLVKCKEFLNAFITYRNYLDSTK